LNGIESDIMNTVYAGILAGLGMAAAMGIGERLGLFKINLPFIDGKFFFKGRFDNRTTYLLGLFIHLMTSISFALGYVLFRIYVVPYWSWQWAGPAWTIILWFLFGITVSPVTGYGLFGSRAGKWAWFELLITHCVYGIILTVLLR